MPGNRIPICFQVPRQLGPGGWPPLPTEPPPMFSSYEADYVLNAVRQWGHLVGGVTAALYTDSVETRSSILLPATRGKTTTGWLIFFSEFFNLPPINSLPVLCNRVFIRTKSRLKRFLTGIGESTRKRSLGSCIWVPLKPTGGCGVFTRQNFKFWSSSRIPTRGGRRPIWLKRG